MRSWLHNITQGITKEHLFTMGMTLLAIGVTTAAEAAGGGGAAVGSWAPMNTIAQSVSGTPAFACGSVMGVGAGVRIMMGEIGLGMYNAACVVGGGWLACNAGPALTTFGIAGAVS